MLTEERAGKVVTARRYCNAAAEGGNDQVITALIRAGAGADKNGKAPDSGRTPLHIAALGGKEATAKALIMAGADENILDADKVSGCTWPSNVVMSALLKTC